MESLCCLCLVTVFALCVAVVVSGALRRGKYDPACDPDNWGWERVED